MPEIQTIMKVYQVSNNFLPPRNDTYNMEKFRCKGAPRKDHRRRKSADKISISYRWNLPRLVSNAELKDKQMNFSTVISYINVYFSAWLAFLCSTSHIILNKPRLLATILKAAEGFE